MAGAWRPRPYPRYPLTDIDPAALSAFAAELRASARATGAFGFVLGHGVSAVAAFRMRSDPRPENVAALLNLSSASLAVMYPSLLVLLVAGIAGGFMGDWWGSAWIWVSIVVLVVVLGVMYAFGMPYYIAVRHAVGIPAPQDGKNAPPPTPMAPNELATLLKSRRPELLAAVGGIGLVVIIRLMVIKPW